MSIHYALMQSPVGQLLVVSDSAGLKEIRFEEKDLGQEPEVDWIEGGGHLEPALSQLQEYFDGTRREFDLPLAPEGTDFQHRVWDRLCDIPYGETISYGELARRIGKPTASRAVGAANGRNPLPIVIPCHRVIGKSGALTGFAGGITVKRRLLALEGSPSSAQAGELFPSNG